MNEGDLLDLGAVRAEIDTIDAHLVSLLVQRQRVVARAAAFKRDEDEVRAPDRAAAVIDRAADLAAEAGGSPDLVRAVYEALVAAFIDHELARHGESSTE